MFLHHIQHTKTMEGVEIMEETTIMEAKEDVTPNVDEIGEIFVVAVRPLI